jgi:hypothetical protein
LGDYLDDLGDDNRQINYLLSLQFPLI